MRRTLVALILMASMVEAQEVKTFGELSSAARRPLRLDGTFGLSYDKLRQGGEEYGEVSLYSSQDVFLSNPEGKDVRSIGTRLEIEPVEGLQISRVIYPKAQEEQFQFDSKPIKVLHQGSADRLRFRFKVRSAPDLRVGIYVLRAKLSFQIVSDSGISDPKELLVEIPIDVVGHDAKVESVDRSIAGIRGITPAEWAAIVLFAPVSIPFGLFMMLIGWDGC